MLLRQVIICLNFNVCVKEFTTRKADKHYALSPYEEITDICLKKMQIDFSLPQVGSELTQAHPGLKVGGLEEVWLEIVSNGVGLSGTCLITPNDKN